MNQETQTRTPKTRTDKIMSQNRFRPLTPEEDTNEEEYQTDETDSSLESLQTLNRKYKERMAIVAAARQNQNQNAPGPKEIRINLLKEFSGSQSKAGPFL